MSLLIKITKRLNLLRHKFIVSLYHKTVFVDRYGLKYYLWANTRLADTVLHTKVRTDDTGVIEVIKAVLIEVKKEEDEIQCIDVGGYIGVITLAMAKYLGDSGRVYTFEAFSDTFKRLFENVKELNQLDKVTLINSAISNKSGLAKITTIENAGGTFIEDLSPNEKCEKTSLMTTVDSFSECYGLERVTLMKVDAEGVDDKVLEGASKLLKTGSIDYLIVEHDTKMGIGEKIEAILKKYNYSIYYIICNGDKVVSSLDKYPANQKEALNVLAVAPNAIAKVQVLKSLILD